MDYAINNLVSPEAKKEVESLINNLNEASKIAKQISLDAGNAKTIKESAIAQEKLNKAQAITELNAKKIEAIQNKMNIDAQKEIDRKIALENRANASKLKALENERKAQERLTKEVQASAEKANKLVNAFKSAPTGSIQQLSAANAILNKRLSEVNQTTEAGRTKANNLRSAIDKNHEKLRAMSPEWKKQQMNIGNYGSAMDKLKGVTSKITGVFFGLTAVLGAGSFAMNAFNRTMNITQGLADKLAVTKEGLKQATDAFFRSIALGDWSNLIDNMRVAYEEGKRYADMLDLLEDRGRAVNIQVATIDTEIERLKNLARDRTQDLKARKDAIDQIVKLEKEKLVVTKGLANDELQNKLKNVSTYSTLSAKAIEAIISDQSAQIKLTDAWNKDQELRSKSLTTVTSRQGGTITFFDEAKYNQLLMAESSAVRAQINIAKQWNKVSDTDRATLEKLMINKQAKETAYQQGVGSLVKMKNKLESEFLAVDANIKKQQVIANHWSLAMDADFIKEKKALENERISGEIATTTELNEQLLDLEIFYLQKRIASRKDSGAQLIEIEQQLRSKMIEKLDGDIKGATSTDKETTDDSAIIKLEILKNKELQINALLYRDKIINKQAYEEENARIEAEYSKQSIDLAIKTAEAQLELLKREPLSEGNKQKILDLEKQIAQAKRDSVDVDLKVGEDADAKRLGRLQKYAEVAMSIMSSISNLTASISQESLKAIDLETSANEENRRKELDALENRNKVKTTLEKQQDAINDKYNKKALEAQKKKDIIERKQAIWKRMASIAEVEIQTALGIVEAKGNVAKIALVSALGAVNLATILATKIPEIPKYAKGTAFHGGGHAIVGDAGRELVQMPNSDLFMSPSSSTVVDLPRGAKVFTNFQTEQMVRNDYTNVNFKKLEEKQDKTNKYLAQIAQKENNIRIFVKNDSMKNKYKYN